MKIHLVLGACTLTLGACTQDVRPLPYTPTPLPAVATQEATLSTTVVSAISHPNPLAGYTYRGPTGPRDWRTVNQEQSEGN